MFVNLASLLDLSLIFSSWYRLKCYLGSSPKVSILIAPRLIENSSSFSSSFSHVALFFRVRRKEITITAIITFVGCTSKISCPPEIMKEASHCTLNYWTALSYWILSKCKFISQWKVRILPIKALNSKFSLYSSAFRDWRRAVTHCAAPRRPFCRVKWLDDNIYRRLK